MGKDLNKVFDFIDGTKEAQKSGNKNDPLSDYIAYEKAKDMEKAVSYTHLTLPTILLV